MAIVKENWLRKLKPALPLLMVLFSVFRVEAAGIKGLIGEYIHVVDDRIALQAIAVSGSEAEARYRKLCDAEEALETELQGIFRGNDDIAEVAMGFLAEADIGGGLLYFRGMIPTDSPTPAAVKLLEKMEALENRRKSGEKTTSEPGHESPTIAPPNHDGVTLTSAPGDDIPPDLAKFQKINDQKPTYYFTVREVGFPTSGPLYGHSYNGSERKSIRTPAGALIAETSGRFFAAISMEGSGVVKDGRTVSFVSNQRFQVAPEGCLGITATGYWVVPFHTLAVNRNQMPYRGVYFIPGTRGLKLPNGKIHDGYWFAHDTGSAFTNAVNRVDMYVDREENVKWMEAAFVPSFTPVKFYKVDSDTKTRVYAKYQSILGKPLLEESFHRDFQ